MVIRLIFLLNSGKVLVIGGDAEEFGFITNSVESYDPHYRPMVGHGAHQRGGYSAIRPLSLPNNGKVLMGGR